MNIAIRPFRLFSSFVVVGFALQSLPSAAQQSPADEQAEIIVTARKRPESIQDVPVIETAISQESLEKYQTHDLYTLATRVPGLVMDEQIGAIGAGVSIRGIGTNAENATIDQSVSLNIDGLSLSQALAYKGALFDDGQVEVLKGPQALFYGKNSPGGVISIRTADPTSQTEVIANTGYEFEAKEKFGEVVISGPVSDFLKLRLAGHYSTNDGYFRNLDTAPAGYGVLSPTTRDFYDDTNWILRGTALFDLSETYDARLKLNATHDFTNHVGIQLGACPYGKVSFTGLPVFDPNEDCTLNRDVYDAYMNPAYFPGIRNGGVPYYLQHEEFGTLEQNLHFDGALTATSVTGFYQVHQQSVDNGSGTSGVVTLATNNDFSIRQFTEEARLTSNYTSPVNFMAGVFYQNERMVNHVQLLFNTGIPGIPLPGLYQNVIHSVDINSTSGFGQVIWKILNNVELAAGARVTHETRDHTEDNLDLLSGPLGDQPLIDPRLSSTDTSPEVSLTYKPIDEVTLFGSFKEGFKSGSFNTVTYIDPKTPQSFGDEKVKGGEVGLKSRLADHRLSLNIAVYDYKYTGLQVGANTITPQGVIALTTLNAASATVRGVDFDTAYSPEQITGLTVHVAGNYNHARYDSFPNAPCLGGQLISEGCNQLFDATTMSYGAQNLAGRPLVRAPDWVVTPGADYDLRVGQNMTLTFGANASYSSKYYTNLVDSNMAGFLQGSYVKTSLNIGLRGPNDAWSVAIIGNNITDKITAGFCANAPVQGAIIFGGAPSGTNTRGPGGGDYPECQGDRGRELWLRVTVRPLAFFNER